ncbi:MAG: YceI family protein [Bacteroidales bacterium]
MEIVFNLPNPDRSLSKSDQFENEPKTENTHKICIDPLKSFIHWKGTKPGGEHIGTVKFSSGYIKLEDNNVTGGSFVADMTTITDEDQRMKEMKEMLENHLKSADFFDVKNFPTSTFEIHKVTLLPEDPVFVMEISGALTIKDIAQEVSFKIKQLSQVNPVSFTTNEVILNRTIWKINYNSKSIFKSITDKIIHDEFELSATIVLKGE